MVVDKARGEADFQMLFFNSDGSVGEMCGNGARCICRYGYETGLAGEHQVVETTAGIVTGDRISRCQYRVRLNDPTTVRLQEVFDRRGQSLSLRLCGAGGTPACPTRWSPAPAWPRPIPRPLSAGPGPAVSPPLPQGGQREFLRSHRPRPGAGKDL